MNARDNISLAVLFFGASLAGVAQNFNYSVTNEEIELHMPVFLEEGLPYSDGVVVYDNIYNDLDGSEKELIIEAFLEWYKKFYGVYGFSPSCNEEKGFCQFDFYWTFRFWNKASYKIINAKSELRFYAKENRARFVLDNIRVSLTEGDFLTPGIVKGIRNLSRAVDRSKAGDPNYPYDLDMLMEDSDQSVMKRKLLVAFDFVARSMSQSLEDFLANYAEWKSTDDDW